MAHIDSIWNRSTATTEWPSASTLMPTREYPLYAEQLPPTPEGSTSYEENAALIRRIAEGSAVDAIDVWIGGVGHRWFEGDRDAARRAGAADQPHWDYKAEGGFTVEKEEAGNFNFGSSGYTLGMTLLVDNLGMSEDVSAPLVKWILRLGGGWVQAVGDVGTGVRSFMRTTQLSDLRSKIAKTSYTWYGEEQADVPVIEAGMRYGEYLRAQRAVGGLSVELDPATYGLGVKDTAYQPSPLLNRSFETELSADVFIAAMLKEIRRIESEARRSRGEQRGKELE